MFEGESMDVLIMVMAGAAALTLAYTFWRGFVHKDPYEARMKLMTERRAAYKAAALSTAKTGPAARPKGKGGLTDLIRAAAKGFKGKTNTANSPTGVTPRLLLARAGIRHKDAPEFYLLARAVLPFLFAGLVALYIATSAKYNPSPMTAFILCGSAAGAGFFAPSLFIRNKISKRKKMLRRQLPDALDLLVVCAEAGLALNAALDRVVREMSRSAGVISDELGLLQIELNFLDERRKAFQNAVDRTDLDEMRAITNTLMQAEKYGTPLAHALRVLGAEFRADRLSKAEAKAARLPAIMTVPMIVFILPCLFIVIIGPAILRTIDSLGKMG